MRRVTKKAERLARALCVVEGTLPDSNMKFDRAHLYWPTLLDKAEDIIEAQNLLALYEDIGRPLHGSVEDADLDMEVYQKFYKGPHNHGEAFDAALGLSED